MKTGRTWLVYSLVRLGIFAVVLAALLLTQIQPFIAAAVAAVISLCASYIFLRKPREELAAGLYEARHGDARVQAKGPEKAGSDEENEDAVEDARASTVHRANGGAATDGVADTDATAGDATAGESPAGR